VTDTPNISWFAVRVAPNTEFRVRDAINQWDRPAIVPFEMKWVRINGKPRERRLALFPSYVFGGFTGDETFAAWSDFAEVRRMVNRASELTGKAPPIIGVVGYGQKPARLSGAEISWLSTLSTSSGSPPWEKTFTPGQTVEITGTGTSHDGTRTKITKVSRSKVSVMLKMFNSYMEVEMQQKNIQAA
jgi:transcription antitermination factor NusG